MNHNNIERKDTFRDKLIPWYIVAFFVFIFVVNMIMINLANDTFTGLVTDNAYEKGINHNATIAEMEAQKNLEWSDHFNYTSYGNKKGRIEFNVKDKNNNSIIFSNVFAKIFRPIKAGHDTKTDLYANISKTYSADIEVQIPGQWEIQITAHKDNFAYKQSYRIIVE